MMPLESSIHVPSGFDQARFAAAVGGPTEARKATPGANILIVDDEPSAIVILRQALEGYASFRFATNAADALRLVRERPPDLILLDENMPGESGHSVCHKLKRDELLCDIPIIFVTAQDDIRSEAQAFHIGAADFLSKPISPPRVRARVRLHLQLKSQMDQLRILSLMDGLTLLANRRAVDERLEREWRRALRTGLPLSLIMIDVDFFNAFNDTYGHPAGDDCLKVVAAAVARAARRPSDLAGRFGGDEFVVILPETRADGALAVAIRLRDDVVRAAIPHRTSGVAAHITVSIGVSCMVTDDPVAADPQRNRGHFSRTMDMGELVAAADRALYRAKQGGRNRTEFDPLSFEPVS